MQACTIQNLSAIVVVSGARLARLEAFGLLFKRRGGLSAWSASRVTKFKRSQGVGGGCKLNRDRVVVLCCLMSSGRARA